MREHAKGSIREGILLHAVAIIVYRPGIRSSIPSGAVEGRPIFDEIHVLQLVFDFKTFFRKCCNDFS